MLQPFDRERLRTEFATANPFPHVKIDNFIDPKKAKEIAAAYPRLTSPKSREEPSRP
jgi:hypothetical protein